MAKLLHLHRTLMVTGLIAATR